MGSYGVAFARQSAEIFRQVKVIRFFRGSTSIYLTEKSGDFDPECANFITATGKKS